MENPTFPFCKAHSCKKGHPCNSVDGLGRWSYLFSICKGAWDLITWIFLSCITIFLLTETQWIHINFIGQETKPGHILIMRQIMTNRKYQFQLWTSLVSSAWISPINFSIFMQSFVTRASIKKLKIHSFMHTCVFTRNVGYME